jgi:PAS domain S-box-containing protein
MSEPPASNSSARLARLQDELLRCISGELDCRLTTSSTGDDLDAIATGINVLLDEVQFAIAETAARRRTEQVLQKQALVFNSIEEGVSVIGPEGLIVAWNPAAHKLFGLVPEQVLGKPPFPMLPALHATQSEQEVQSALDLGEPWVEEVQARGSDGQARICEVTAVPIRGDAGEHLGRVQLYRDVTDARLLERRLRHVERLKSLGVLAGGIAHDFNNQLAGIQSAAEVLMRRLGEDPEVSPTSYVQAILRSVHRASALTTQLLAFARQGPLQLEPVDIDAVIHEVVDLFRRTVDKRYTVRLDLSPPGGCVQGDVSQLHNALLNIMLNARDAMPDGGTLHVSSQEVTHAPSSWGDPALPLEGGSYLRISIRDHGAGMRDEVKRDIFEPFFTTKPQGQGVGMGLSAVFGVVKSHAGAIEVTSVPQEGSVFSLNLPLSDNAPPMQPSDDYTPTASTTLKGARILLIDDEDLILSLVSEFLQFENATVHAYSDGRDALTYFEAQRDEVDAVVLDMMMPTLHGRDVLARLRELAPTLPVVICSGYNDGYQTGAPQMGTGPTVFLPKPYELTSLAKALDSVMRPSRASDTESART